LRKLPHHTLHGLVSFMKSEFTLSYNLSLRDNIQAQ
jgi:hypothetical protein